MSGGIRIGAEVRASVDMHPVSQGSIGVVVDSHPERGWLVWWCPPQQALWARTEEIAVPAPSAASGGQPAPSGGRGDVWSEVIAGERDAELRRMFAGRWEFGISKYGVPVTWGDGRDELRDLTDELLDGIVYASRLRWRWTAWTLRALLILATRGASLRSFLTIAGVA